ncbi:hypothetical protein ebA1660 [Aromatoleum aromaticum EbN1]|uniref:Uncharacterized protein n=1 Tax=Aromatoleum aromaticum (strain DSM 19018 / LMG 30748 / EbN1) TaxID=76114 RepID=Q5P6N5_AROAE|nr:hypothetical protein ebA1660 [Aromatoleum aromaticum EbN1]
MTAVRYRFPRGRLRPLREQQRRRGAARRLSDCGAKNRAWRRAPAGRTSAQSGAPADRPHCLAVERRVFRQVLDDYRGHGVFLEVRGWKTTARCPSIGHRSELSGGAFPLRTGAARPAPSQAGMPVRPLPLEVDGGLCRGDVDGGIGSGIVDVDYLDLIVDLIRDEDVVGLVEVGDGADAGRRIPDIRAYPSIDPRRASPALDGGHCLAVQGEVGPQVLDGDGSHISSGAAFPESGGSRVEASTGTAASGEAAEEVVEKVAVLAVAVVRGHLRRHRVDLDDHRTAAGKVCTVGDGHRREHRLEVLLLRRVGLIEKAAADGGHGLAIEGLVEGKILDGESRMHGSSPETSVGQAGIDAAEAGGGCRRLRQARRHYQ